MFGIHFFLTHFDAAIKVTQSLEVEAYLDDHLNMIMHTKKGNRRILWSRGRLGDNFFTGWRVGDRADVSFDHPQNDKLVYKSALQAANLRTPTAWTTQDILRSKNSIKNVLIKEKLSAGGRFVRGPFKKGDKTLADDEYYESFIEGQSVKAWFIDDKVVALEVRDPVMLRPLAGKTVDETFSLEYRSAYNDRNITQSEIDILAYQGVTPSDVLKGKEKIMVEFRHVSPIRPVMYKQDTNVLAQYKGTAIEEQLLSFAKVVTPKVSIYTIDAVLDNDGSLWALEFNPHPSIHPAVYSVMIPKLLAE